MYSFLLAAFLITASAVANQASCAILSIPLTEEKPGASLASRQSNFVRDGIIFLTKTSLPLNLGDINIGKNAITFPAEGLTPPVVSFFASLSTLTNPFVAFDRLTSPEYTALYLAMRAYRHPSYSVPDTKAEFEADLGYAVAVYTDSTPNKWVSDVTGQWFRKIIPVSLAKGRERILYRPQASHPRFGLGKGKITIATTPDETEIALKREDGSNDWDYYGYGLEGKLSPVANFATSHHTMSEGNSPHSCMTCHYSVNARSFKGIR